MNMRDPSLESALDVVLAGAPVPVPSNELVRRIVVSSVTLPQMARLKPPRGAVVADAIRVAIPRLLMRSSLGGALAASLVLGILLPWQRDVPDSSGPSSPAPTVAVAQTGPRAVSQSARDETPIAGARSDESGQLAYSDQDETSVARPAASSPVRQANVSDRDNRSDATALAVSAMPASSIAPTTPAAVDFKLAAKAPEDPAVYGPVLDPSSESGRTPNFGSSGSTPAAARAFVPSH